MNKLNEFVAAIFDGKIVDVVSAKNGNLTRGEFGVYPVPEIVIWDENEYRRPTTQEIDHFIRFHPEKLDVGCWDPDFGYLTWPSSDLRIRQD